MANVKNVTDRPLALPTGGIIPAGRTLRVDNWDGLQSHPIVKGWIAAKAVEVQKEKPAPEAKADKPSRGS